MTVPQSRSESVERTITGEVKLPTSLQPSPASVASANPGDNPAESVDTAAATWLQLIHRYFQVNRGSADQHDRDETTIV